MKLVGVYDPATRKILPMEPGTAVPVDWPPSNWLLIWALTAWAVLATGGAILTYEYLTGRLETQITEAEAQRLQDASDLNTAWVSRCQEIINQLQRSPAGGRTL